jgi:hypothetical protein
MPFVFESVTNSDKEQIGTIESPLTHQPIFLTQWTADHGRRAFLIRAGKDRDELEDLYLIFFVGAAKFHIGVKEKIRGTAQGDDVAYSIRFISQVEGLPQDALAIKDLLKEALTTDIARVQRPHILSFDTSF